MRAAIIAVALVCASAATSAQAQERTLEAVPDRWIGEWNEDQSACGTGLNDSRLRISTDSIMFYESGGLVRGVFENGPFEILIVADMSGEGQTWLASHHFRMSASGSYISMDTGDGTPFVRYRCEQSTSSIR